MRPLVPIPFLLRSPFFILALHSALFAKTLHARTVTFDPGDASILYSPVNAWETGSGNSMRSVREGATVNFRFAGEQVTLFGSTTSSNISMAISLDGQAISDTNTTFSLSRSASPSKLVQLSNLDRNGNHSLKLRIADNETLVLSRIAVAYSSASEKTPALLPDTASISPASLSSSASTSSSSPTLVPLQSASSSPFVNGSHGSSMSAGLVVGVTLAALFLFSLLFSLAFYFYHRHRRHSLDPSSPQSPSRHLDNAEYINHETGNRRGSFLHSAFQSRRASSLLPWNSTPRTPLSPSPILFTNAGDSRIDGGIGSSPRAQVPTLPPPVSPLVSSSSTTPTPVIVGSQSWQAKLTRAASWKRKAERLAETRKFYGVGARSGKTGEVKGPPPALPLPRPPGASIRGDGVREMDERWRSVGPTLDVRGNGLSKKGGGNERRVDSPPMSISPYLVDTPPEDSQETTTQDANRFEHAYGVAISTRDEEDLDDVSSVQVASPTSTIHPHHPYRAAHLRHRSLSSTTPLPAPHARETYSPRLPPSPFYQNPFSATRSVATTASRQSYDESSRSSSIEHARISLAQARAVRPSNDKTGGGRGQGGIGQSHPNRPLPLRADSMTRSIGQGTVRAGPRGDTSVVGPLESEVMVERKPSLTRIVNGKIAGTRSGLDHGKRTRHQSQAAIIVDGREDASECARKNQSEPTGRIVARARTRREEPELPSEEDRSDYFVKRQVVPKYSQAGGDPRRK